MPPNPTPLVIELAQRFRAQLLARERRAAGAIVRFYGVTWQRLQPQIQALSAEAAAMTLAGQEIGPGAIWRLERMKAIQAQAAAEAVRFAEFADVTVTAGQREALVAGQRNAHDLILGSFPADAGLEISFAAMPAEAVETMVGFLADGSPLRRLLTEAVGASVDDFAQTMVTGLAAGWNPRRLAGQLRSSFGMGLTRALGIARTEQLRAYSTATLNSYQQSDLVTGWERMATHDERTCMACMMLDGKRYRKNEPMDDHPSGRCTMLPITKSYRELGIAAAEPDFRREMGEDWFLRQNEGVQRTMMGSGMFEGWKAGEFGLTDIPVLRRDDVWGNSWVPSPLGDLIGG